MRKKTIDGSDMEGPKKMGIVGGVTTNSHTDQDGTAPAGDLQETHDDASTATATKQQAGFRARWKDPEYRRKVWRTVWLGASFWGLGFAVSQRGPAFLDIQIITGTDVERASFFFTAHSAGYLVGSLTAGVIYDLLNKSLLFLVCVAGQGLCTMALPWCSPYWLMIAINFVVALFGGAIDAAGNAELFHLWGKDGEMAMQSIQFAFAIGGVIGPLVTEPFLTPSPEEVGGFVTMTTPTWPLATNSISMAASNVSDPWNATSAVDVMANSTAPPPPLPLTTNVHYAFLISGGIILLITVPLTLQLFSDRSQKRRQDRKDEKKDTKQPLPLKLFLFVQGMLCLFYLLNCSVEDTFASFLTTFAVKQLSWSKSRGAQVTGLYWAVFAVSRFLCIFLVHVLSSVKLLALSCVWLVLAQLAMLLFSAHGVDWGVWVATVLVGAAMAPVFPTGFTWMEVELVRVTGRVASSVLITSSVGMIVSPVLVGFLMQEVTPMWYCYLLLLLSLLVLAIFLILLAFSRLYLHKHHAVRRTPATQEIVVTSLQESASGNSIVVA